MQAQAQWSALGQGFVFVVRCERVAFCVAVRVFRVGGRRSSHGCLSSLRVQAWEFECDLVRVLQWVDNEMCEWMGSFFFCASVLIRSRRFEQLMYKQAVLIVGWRHLRTTQTRCTLTMKHTCSERCKITGLLVYISVGFWSHVIRNSMFEFINFCWCSCLRGFTDIFVPTHVQRWPFMFFCVCLCLRKCLFLCLSLCVCVVSFFRFACIVAVHTRLFLHVYVCLSIT